MRKVRFGKCSICHTDKKVKKQRKTGRLRCQGCINPKARCSRCREWDYVYARDELGRPLCPRHAPKVEEKCPRCGHERRLKRRRKFGGEKMCNSCYRNANKEMCIGCSLSKPVQARDEEDRPLCANCNGKRKRGLCAQCFLPKRLSNRNAFHQRICRACKANPYRGPCGQALKTKAMGAF